MPKLDDGPIVVRLRSVGLAFTRRGLADWVRNTPPGFAHPIRRLLAITWMKSLVGGDMDSPGQADEKACEQANEAAELAVLTVDELIANGEIKWLADDIREWEKRPPTVMSGIFLTR